jgi:energy-coupling factor transporter transmembrane protein EcfT
MLDALRRLWHYPLSRNQVRIGLLTFLLFIFVISGFDPWRPLIAVAVFIVIGVIPYLIQRRRQR